MGGDLYSGWGCQERLKSRMFLSSAEMMSSVRSSLRSFSIHRMALAEVTVGVGSVTEGTLGFLKQQPCCPNTAGIAKNIYESWVQPGKNLLCYL